MTLIWHALLRHERPCRLAPEITSGQRLDDDHSIGRGEPGQVVKRTTRIDPDVDLDTEDIRLPDGSRLTEAKVDEIVERVHRHHPGRPSVSGERERTPVMTVRVSRAARAALEWSFSQTLRHLVLATNAWLHGAIGGRQQPFHWIGQPYAEYESDGGDMTIFREPASYDEVLAVRAEHQKMVRDYLATVTEEALAETRPHPWAPECETTIRHCLHVILNEEWQHHRYAVRDLQKAAAV
ncbi:MAG: DinB family protein [Mycobacteriales bacterium]